ncbi:hypothetical protein BS643_14925 [Pseudomonas protegens]|uniref:hypothetical protein n=1 Tax=Pseudomonas TaxID=286 RepID=UPI0008070E7E|nr:hypothetical protein [Pseudomonas protegens]OBZ25052.1 hypothetical protein BBH58_06125 [Pseudomonas protegens]OBZ31837.1 hypothetical protein BBH57_18615 [Pseudomonas protegens]OKK42365.1 hypothetical protein BS644_17475 [Pseudomonas protegens]OKK46818.1 hypothetical protein BS643_14925 [Pseudomonas protegens]OKK61818.1 hypothetical protein BS645_10350 [Pseudomonas protegens]
MAKLKIEKVLLSYEMPLVVLAKSGAGDRFLGVNYDDASVGHKFYFSRIKTEHLKLLYAEKIDVHYAVTKLHTGKYEFGELWGKFGEEFQTKRFSELDPDFLPEPGMFIPGHAQESLNSDYKVVDIDGRWEISDLRKFSDLVQDCYSFGFALLGATGNAAKAKIDSLFHKHPWRGGFSSVNFFKELYKNIPQEDRAGIRKIDYASPGEIKFYMNGDVADSIRELVLEINDDESPAQESYRKARRFLQDRNWLSKSDTDIQLSASDLVELTQLLYSSCKAFGLQDHSDHILGLASGDPLSAVKIVLAYFRRLQGLADYVATGKAQDIFRDA